MIRYERRNLFRAGLIGVVLVILVGTCATKIAALPLTSTGRVFTAEFADAAGLKVGDPVQQVGVTVGRVLSMSLDGDHVDVRFRVDGQARLGSATTVSISTATALGTRNLAVRSAGSAPLQPDDVIPRSRTRVPYDLTAALGDLAASTKATDTDQLADSLRAVNDVLSQTPQHLRPAVEGLGALSATVAQRDEQLRALLDKANQVSGVLAQRSDNIATLIGDADVILAELVQRRSAVETLFANVTALSRSLSAVIADNRAQLGPMLTSVDGVLQILERNRTNIGTAISSLAPYVTELGEAVSSGPFFSSYITNLLPGQVIEPFIRQAMAAQGITMPKGLR